MTTPRTATYPDVYTTDNYPFFLAPHGNWGIWLNASGRCAAIPTPKAARQGCRSSHFGDIRYALRALA